MIGYFESTFFETLKLLLFLAGPLFFLAVLMHYVSDFICKKLMNTVGMRIYVYLIAWLGTAVHECGHAFFCIIFRHKIVEMKLFKPDSEEGTLGYVSHQYDKKSLYQNIGNFFIGIGPIISGTLVICLASYLLIGVNLATLPRIKDFAAFWTQSGIAQQPVWKICVFVYIVFSVGSSITLSPPDITTSIKGAFFTLIFIFILHFAIFWLDKAHHLLINGYRLAAYNTLIILIVVLVINLIFAFILTLVNQVIGK